MTNSKIPKFTRSRPMGLGQTPFNPMTGKYASLANKQDILKVVVEYLIDGQMYLCSVLNERGTAKSGEKIEAHRITYDADDTLEEIAGNTVTFAYKISNRWWIQKPDASETIIPTVDFIVDMFDRANLGNLGQYWENTAAFRIYNQESILTQKSSIENYPYSAKLSSHNMEMHFSYLADENIVADLNWFVNVHGLSATFYLYFFKVRIGHDSLTNTGHGIYVRCRLRTSGKTALYTLYNQSTIVAEYEEVISSVSQVPYQDDVSIIVNENLITINSRVFALTFDSGAVLSDQIGLRSGNGNGIYPDYDAEYQIDNIKAWVSSIPEPPDESGHGKYINDLHRYSDKYHSGGVYNPDA